MKDIKEITNILGLKKNSSHMTDVMAMILSNARLAGEIEDGYFMAKQKFVVNHLRPIEEDKLNYSARILTRKRAGDVKYIHCRSQVYYNDHLHSELYTSLIKKKQAGIRSLNNIKHFTESPMEKLTSFSPEQITAFSKWSGDMNSIHLGEKPVVQGMLLLLALEDYLCIKGFKIRRGNIRYLHPIKACEDIFIYHEQNKITGISKDKECFILEITGESSCLKKLN